MKKSILILLFSFSVTLSFSQEPTFTVRYFDVMPGAEQALADLYDSYFEGVEFKSGGLYLERMDRGDVLGTHRIVFFGELGNWGIADDQKTRQDWQLFWEARNKFIEKRGPSYSGRILASNGKNPADLRYFQMFDIEVSDPAKFAAAHNKIVEQIKDATGDNAVMFGTYDVGSPGSATHWIATGTTNVGPMMRWYMNSEKYEKEWADYYKNRGEVKTLSKYSLRILRDYGSFN
ncbi:MAG: hypothetical protein ISQ41_04955 [Flavobacteriaceae bacterium]|nr:hypothetical protein [Flavobacteriaceae bacterium]MBL6684794.1 hypothetical protein [Flavobacteriaceae bacterium]PDH52673.1 MAG: hypothetical protein CND00_02105 [Cryomorphaceae bacterium MED-G14]|tara:strand:+ start:989 stop:1687 length:699 start_codon:yes stop_codon:yes gene_type:complete